MYNFILIIIWTSPSSTISYKNYIKQKKKRGSKAKKKKTCFTGPTDPDFSDFLIFFFFLQTKKCKISPFLEEKLNFKIASEASRKFSDF